MAWNPSYRAPSAADLHDEDAHQPPGPDAPLEAWGAKDLVVRDGVVVGCSLSGRAFLSLKRCELSEVRLVAVQPFMAELARCPHLAKLHRLDLSGSRIGIAGAKSLAESRLLGSLKELVLSRNNLNHEGLELVSRAEWFPNLDVLEVADNGLTVLPLAASRQLQSLDLSKNPLSPEIRLPDGLRRLAFSHCSLGPTVATLAASGCFKSLSELDLSFNDIEDSGVEALAAAGPFPSLVALDLTSNRITARGAALLAKSLAFESVQTLELSVNPLGNIGPLAHVLSVSLGNLRHLELDNCGLHQEAPIA